MYDQEIPLEIRKASVAMEFNKIAREFALDKSQTFVSASEKMKGMNHGPNHTEGDPLEHTQLYVAELKSYLEIHKDVFTTEEIKLLQLTGILHDIGKAETQKYDVVSAKQNLVVGATPEQILEAQNLKLQILSEVSGKSLEEIKALSGGKQRDLMTQYEVKLREQLALVAENFPALAVNFRGHDEKSAAMGEVITQEAGTKITPEDAALLHYLLERHMDLLDFSDLTEEDLNDSKKIQGQLKIFSGLFVEGEKGENKVNEQKIKMLLALTYADNASTYHKGQSDKDRQQDFKQITKVIEFLKEKTESILKKEAEDKKVSDVIKEAFKDQGDLTMYLKTKGLVGKAIGDAANVVRDYVRANLEKDFEMLCEEAKKLV